MRFRSIRFTLALAACWFGLMTMELSARTWVQAEAPASAEEVPDAPVGELVRMWEELDSDLADLEVDFKSEADPAKQEELRGRYTVLAEKSENIVSKIRTKAVDSLATGSLDENSSKLLVGLMMNDAEYERYNDVIKLGDKLIAAGIDSKYLEQASKADRLSIASKELVEELLIRQKQNKKDDLPQVKIVTSKGELMVELFEDEAPNTVANFVSLIEKKFYDGLKFHRVVEGFVAQGGDPKGDGTGGPGYTIKCECSSPESRRHYFGSLSMAHAGLDTGGSQFFVCLDRSSTAPLDGKHTVFGRVVSGLEVLDKLSRNYTSIQTIADADTDIIKSMTIVRKRDHEYAPETTPKPEEETDSASDKKDDAAGEETKVEEKKMDAAEGTSNSPSEESGK